MTSHFINQDCFAQLSADHFRAVSPYPWFNFQDFLQPDKFAELFQNFPALDFFVLHQDLPRKDGQRPHNRYYLAYERSIYTEKPVYTQLKHQDKGIILHHMLPEVWQRFIKELNESSQYRDLMTRLLGAKDFNIRYAWHIGVTRSEVSPHRDSGRKLGTHIFYFNTDTDWDTAWGGEFLILDGKPTDISHPDFDDFTSAHSVPFLNNQSLLFKNTPNAWHGVKSLTCPEGHYRRLFNVIFEPLNARQLSLTSSLRRLTTRWFSRLRA